MGGGGTQKHERESKQIPSPTSSLQRRVNNENVNNESRETSRKERARRAWVMCKVVSFSIKPIKLA